MLSRKIWPIYCGVKNTRPTANPNLLPYRPRAYKVHAKFNLISFNTNGKQRIKKNTVNDNY